ncbi:MAG: carbohydrate ABC transporter permease [Clostridia bacterium]|nr:carbohydrate ABC transporter permease [Clostridia bacterium]
MLLSKSVAPERSVLTGTVGILPRPGEIYFDAYRFVFQNPNFVRALFNTMAFTGLGTLIGLAVTAGFAYAMSKAYLRGRRFFIILAIFIMIFSGGLIPTYLVMTELHLVNTFHILYLAGIFNVANMLILKNSFEAVPRELEEAAVIDGAGQWTILWRIYLPLSKAVLAVIALYYAVDYWNNYYTSMIYTTSQHLKSLQLVLKETIYSASDVFLALHGGVSVGEVTSQSTVAACTVIAALPICLVYPFLQKHFAKGVMLGSVKE